MSTILQIQSHSDLITRERQKRLMLRAWILSGLFFMALPGTLLGFSNLMAISANHGLGALPAAWMEGHGHAQMFGWIGSFILGIGFYSQPGVGQVCDETASVVLRAVDIGRRDALVGQYLRLAVAYPLACLGGIRTDRGAVVSFSCVSPQVA